MSPSIKSLALGLTLAVALYGCKRPQTDTHSKMDVGSDTPMPSETNPEIGRQRENMMAAGQAQAQLNPTQGNQAGGTVTFTKTDAGVQVTFDMSGLTPGKHGFHIHETGDCSAPDASSAGGHFNPSNMPHGAPDAARHHAGDFGNIEADASGKAHTQFVSTMLALDGPQSVVGRAVIVHASADDLTSQPAGNAGARIACGVIKAADTQPPSPPGNN